ncbi:outer membrane beta-barrel protein [Mangrovimonas sp. YM274]|uniref:outer membrane beta-barrel protein n=1 Tax=Mangrovimonas sp. YM274 TaxID=3070660 RepID=UPI0027DBCAE7|nr:outer membrane beta-barrel protein [Mangrovimonas sp. YM274]WMI67668.1 outer membrane beta-barrel protein [Mangrovimonas sp. YM274]
MKTLQDSSNLKKRNYGKPFKLLFAMFLFSCFSHNALAQDLIGYGLKGGLNYSTNGEYFEAASLSYKSPDRNIGFHFGLFGKIGGRLYFRPELVYTNTKSEYDNDDLKVQKLDAPMLLGFRVVGPLHVFAGPSFQYILKTEFADNTIDQIENDFTTGLNIGIGVTIHKLSIDLRYERGFNSNEAQFINNDLNVLQDRIDTRPDQFILSLALFI